MNDYILFIDTETSDKPQYWKTPTEEVDHWPYILQIAWIICKKSGEKVLSQDFYINPGEIKMGKDALKVHNITPEFLEKNGIKRKEVLQKLSDDLNQFNPLIVGHFLKFDIKMLEVGFHRAGIIQNLTNREKFCTMFFTRNFHLGVNGRLLRLNELYKLIFKREFNNQHNAFYDAQATKDCFFNLLNKGQFTQKEFHKQLKYFSGEGNLSVLKKVVIPILIILIIIFVLSLLFKFT